MCGFDCEIRIETVNLFYCCIEISRNPKVGMIFRSKIYFSFLLLSGLAFLRPDRLSAQIVGAHAYMKGTGIEIGVNGSGGFEGVDTTVSPVIPGMHRRTNTRYFGFVANPQANGWATFDGDFFTPGAPENGWGFEIGTSAGIAAGNNCNSGTVGVIQNDIPGSMTSWSHTLDCYSATWDGDATSGTNLHFKVNYFFQETDLFYTTTVSITNNTGVTIPDLFYYRNLDPDNNVSKAFYIPTAYQTINTVVSQPSGGGCNIAHVSATQTGGLVSYVGLAAVGANWRAGQGGFNNRDGSNLWNGIGFTQTVGTSILADKSIYLAYRVQNLAPGATETIKFVVILSSAAASNAINNVLSLTYPGSALLPPDACTPGLDTIKTCFGVAVPISITGPLTGDFTWAWTPATGLTPSTGTNVSANPPTTTTYTVTGTPTSACVTSFSMSFVLEILPLPPVQVTPSAPEICPGGTVMLTASGANTYAWTPATGLSCTTCPNPDASPSATTTYSVTGTSTDGCDSVVAVTVIVNPDYSIPNPQVICNGQSYSFNGNTYTTPGFYYDTLHTVAGCDSIIVTDLSVNSSFAINNPQNLCTGQSYTINAHTYSVAGTYEDTLVSVAGCDSIISTVLTFSASFTSNNPQLVCTGSAYNFNGNSYNTAGTYYDTLTSVGGCDSIIITDITMSPVYSIANPQTICNGQTYTFNFHNYTATGMYYDTLMTVDGCDSIIVTDLTVNPTYFFLNGAQICDGQSYTINGNTYTTSGTYFDFYLTVNNCDSIYQTNLVVTPTIYTFNPLQLCNGDSVLVNGTWHSAAGTYNDTLTAAAGCDSVIITTITVDSVYITNNPQFICVGQTYTINGHTYSANGTYNDTLSTVSGCDSVIVTQFTFTTIFQTNVSQILCQGSTYSFNGHNYTTAGVYDDTLTTSGGCDSVITTTITMSPVYSIPNPQSICDNQSYFFNTHSYTTAGTYYDTLFTIDGCDSIIVTNLTVYPTYTIPIAASICQGDYYDFYGFWIFGAGTYNQWFPSINNCDSIIQLTLTVKPVYTTFVADTICQGTTYSFNGHNYTTAGTYYDTLTSSILCDSIIVTDLSVNPNYLDSVVQTLCNGGSYTFNGHTYFTPGYYRDTLAAATGCDSIIVTFLTLYPTYSSSNPPTICGGDTFDIGIHHYTTQGVYYDTLVTASGCDSVVITNLIVNPSYLVNVPVIICGGDTFSLNGHDYTSSGTFYDTLTTGLGCDSIIKTILTVNPSYSFNNPQPMCNGDFYTINGNTYIFPGTYYDTLSTVSGCDSVYVTVLTNYPTFSLNNPQSLCNGQSYSINGNNYSVTGTYYDTLSTLAGCDSVIITQLTVNPVYSINNAQAICNGQTYSLNGHNYTTTGTYHDTLSSINFCDSIVHTQLTVNPVYTMFNFQDICGGQSYTLNGHSYNINGTYYDTLSTLASCDSIIVTILSVHQTSYTNNPQTICNGQTYSFNGNSYSVAGNYNDTLTSIFGCDSVIITQLTVNPVFTTNNPQVICSGQTYTFNLHNYTTAGNHYDTLQSIQSCDSIIVTQLTVNPVYNINNPQVICFGGSYSINGNTYTLAGTYHDTLTSISSCDSIIHTQLSVNPVYSLNNPQPICNGDSYLINGHSYSAVGTYYDTLLTVGAGCDSIIITQISVNPTYSTNNPQIICNGEVYSFNGNNYTVTGNYYDTLPTINGCDSVFITQLTVNPTYSINNPQAICNGQTYTYNGHNYTLAGTYYDTLSTLLSCDSIIVTQLTVNPVYNLNNPQTICNGQTYSINGHNYTITGTYHDTLSTISSCDSIIHTQLTVYPTYSTNNPQVICNGETYTFNFHNYTTTGTYYDTLLTINLCDSIFVTQLTVNPTYSINNPQAICNGDTYTFNGHNYTTTGTYYDTLSTLLTCDSIIVTQLTVNPTYSANNPQTICNGQSYTFNAHNYTIAGTYYDTLLTVSGCDSIFITQLSVNPTYSMNNPQTICNGQTYSLNAHNYTLSGTYYDTLLTTLACDSIIITQLTVNPTYSLNNPQAICDGQNYLINSHSYTLAGTYYDTIQSSLFCDSVIITQLIVNPTYTTNNPQTICEGDVYTFNSHNYSVAGTYNDLLSTISGCDSIILTILSVNPLPVLVFTHPGDLCIDAPPIQLNQAQPSGGTFSGTGVNNGFFDPHAAQEGSHLLSYSYTDPLTNCSNTITEHIIVHPLPGIEFSITPRFATLEDSHILFVDKSPTSVSRLWNFGDNVKSEIIQVMHLYLDTGYFNVTLFITDQFGCANNAGDSVYIGPEFLFFIPNAFTPNGDGKNDSYYGFASGITEYNMRVYDSWGNELFETDDLSEGWDGDGFPADAYVYVVQLTDINNVKHKYVGEFSLIR